jgi:hypothetical protein
MILELADTTYTLRADSSVTCHVRFTTTGTYQAICSLPELLLDLASLMV